MTAVAVGAATGVTAALGADPAGFVLPVAPVPVENVGYSTVNFTANGQNCRLLRPDNYDPQWPTLLVIFCHGAGRTYEDVVGSNSVLVTQPLLDQGFLVASSEQHGANWGNDNSVTDLAAMWDVIDAGYTVEGVVLWGDSMGGISSQRAVAGDVLPNIIGWFGTAAVCDLAQSHDASFGTVIDAAYGSHAAYVAALPTANPVQISASLFDVPMRFRAGTADTTVPKVSHADVQAARVPNGVSVSAGAVGHSDPALYDPDDIVPFVLSLRA